MSIMRYCFLLFILVCITGCYSPIFYEGDGRLIDKGVNHYVHRYLLFLGVLDLTDTRTHRFMANYLPEREFVLGLEVQVQECIEPTEKTLVSFSIVEKETGNIIMDIDIFLSELTWSFSLAECNTMFGYVRSNSTDQGSSFQVDSSSKEYLINISIHPSEDQKIQSARVILEDG